MGDGSPAVTEAPGALATAGPRAREPVAVAGMGVDPRLAAARPRRATVAIVVSQWGSDWGERRTAVRFVAGALALRADIVVVSLDDRSDPLSSPPPRTFDGIFPVHSATAEVNSPAVDRMLRASLSRQPGPPLTGSEVASKRLLETWTQASPEALAILDQLKPDAVVLAGAETFWVARALPVGPRRPRVVVLPLLGTDELLASPALAPLAELADGIGTFSRAEHALAAGSIGARRPELLRRVRLSFPVNRQGAQAGLAGMATFGRYLLVVSGWPDDDPDASTAPPHDYLRSALGDISIAEVRSGRWLVTSGGRRYDVPWAASRMNLWRLMARAVVTLDVRVPGPIGREAVESMLFGTPVVVPAGSVAAEHAKVSNGGLWYGSPGEMLDAVSYFVDHPADRARLARAGQQWAEREHGNTTAMISDVTELALGSQPGPDKSSAAIPSRMSDSDEVSSV
ncbi:MAG: glycosyltransferase [Acidimicrobiales bacterium]